MIVDLPDSTDDDLTCSTRGGVCGTGRVIRRFGSLAAVTVPSIPPVDLIRVGYANVGDRLIVALHDQRHTTSVEATVERIDDHRIALSLDRQADAVTGLCTNADGELVGAIGHSRTADGLLELATFDNVRQLVADTGRDPWTR